MGSGSSRKANDRVIINSPKRSTENGGGGGGGGLASDHRDINRTCPPAFDVRITPDVHVPDGTVVTVRDAELLVLGRLVGRLSREHLKTIETCGKLGVKYRPHVENVRSNVYARFEQQT